MKKLFLAAFAVFAFASVNAQDFGVGAGFANVSIDGESASGFYVKGLVSFEVADSFSVQPEVGYTSSSKDDVSYNLINLNAMAKYNVSEEFSILAGPQVGFASGDLPDALDDAFGDDYSSLNFQLAAGVAYNITENIFAEARYGFQLNEHVEDLGSANVLNIGVGYKF